MILYPKRRSAVFYLLIGIGFVVLGLWMAESEGWIGYACAGFFALCIPVGVVQLLPSSTYLEIKPEGFTICSMFRKTSVQWDVVDEFFVVTMKQTGMTVHKMVGFNYVPSYDRSRIGRRVGKAIAKCEGALPDTFGMKAEELAELLNSKLAAFWAGEQGARQ